MVFSDRREAGQQLAPLLQRFADERPIVVALPRGGVPVAVEVARALDAPLDLLTVRKLGAPLDPEFAIGAIAEDGTTVVNMAVARHVGVTEAELQRIMDRELHELRRRMERFRDGLPLLDVRGRTIIVVDDGLATGLTDLAAVRALRGRGAARIVVAAPVGSREAAATLAAEADEVVCVSIPRALLGVGRWYDDFSPVSDDEVLALLAEAGTRTPAPAAAAAPPQEVTFEVDDVTLTGDLAVPAGARGLVIFAHGSGSSRLSVRNRAVARTLNRAGFATLLFDLLSEPESRRRELVFDIPLLTERLEVVTRRMAEAPGTRALPIGLFGASTGAAAALRAAAEIGAPVRAVVSRGGRADLAFDRLPDVQSPTLLIVGSRDTEVLELNRDAAEALTCTNRVAIVNGAGHLFEEPGALDEVARLAIQWFEAHVPVGDAGPLPVRELPS
jgi:predicted phosphoribosyltransferase/alpha-beta hydrolase superfamily lysophospholipase